MRLLLYLFPFLLFVSCKPSSEEKEQIPLAKVGESYLYESNLQKVMPEDITTSDSLQFIKRYVDTWIEETIMVQRAELNLSEEDKDVEFQLAHYRNSLLSYNYQKALVKQYLDTVVSFEEIEAFYNENKSNFLLKDNILRVIYVKMDRKSPMLTKVRRLYKSSKIKDRTALAELCNQYAENFYLNDESWLLFDDLLKEVPIETYNKESYLKNRRIVEVKDEKSIYLLNIVDFKIRETTSPLNFEAQNIKDIILNKRKLELITKMKNEITAEAFNKNKVEIYINE